MAKRARGLKRPDPFPSAVNHELEKILGERFVSLRRPLELVCWWFLEVQAAEETEPEDVRAVIEAAAAFIDPAVAFADAWRRLSPDRRPHLAGMAAAARLPVTIDRAVREIDSILEGLTRVVERQRLWRSRPRGRRPSHPRRVFIFAVGALLKRHGVEISTYIPGRDRTNHGRKTTSGQLARVCAVLLPFVKESATGSSFARDLTAAVRDVSFFAANNQSTEERSAEVKEPRRS